MLVLQTEVVPDETPENLQWTENRYDNLPLDVAHLDEAHGQRPPEPQYQILHDGEVVEPLQGNGTIISRHLHFAHIEGWLLAPADCIIGSPSIL